MLIRYLNKHKILLELIPYIMVLFGLLVLAFAVSSNRKQTEKNRLQSLRGQTYSISTNCFLAVPADNRTTNYIQECYDKAEKVTGFKIERFGN